MPIKKACDIICKLCKVKRKEHDKADHKFYESQKEVVMCPCCMKLVQIEHLQSKHKQTFVHKGINRMGRPTTKPKTKKQKKVNKPPSEDDLIIFFD